VRGRAVELITLEHAYFFTERRTLQPDSTVPSSNTSTFSGQVGRVGL
jgi:hypothetical protein